jgi:colanic acid/amylovoran biosynthesis protein
MNWLALEALTSAITKSNSPLRVEAMNILFINCVCSNTGDAAILEAAGTVMRSAWKDLSIRVQDDHPERVRKLYPDLNVRGSCYWSLAYTERSGWRGAVQRLCRFSRFKLARRLWGAGLQSLAKRLLSSAEADYLEAYEWADVVIATGGTYLVEQYDLSQRIFDMGTALALKRPLVLFTQSLGPFKDPRNRRRLRAICRRASLIFLRDERSKQHLEELQIASPSILVRPDAAFALADDDLATKPEPLTPLAERRARVAVSVRRWDHFVTGSAQQGMERYLASFSSLVEHLVRNHNADVVFLSTCQGAPGYHDDSQVAATVAAALPKDVSCHVQVDSDFHTPSALVELLRGFDFVVSTRMHLAILALGAGIPVIPIAYEFKTTELCRKLGFAEPPPRIGELSPEKLITSLERFLHDYKMHAHQLNEAVSRFRKATLDVAHVLQDALPRQTISGSANVRSHEPTPLSNRESVSSESSLG